MNDILDIGSTDDESTASDDKLSEERHGTRRFERPKREDMWSTMQLDERMYECTTVTVEGEIHNDSDEPNLVHFRLSGPASITLSLTPSRAREIAGDLLASARVTGAAESEITRGL